MSTLTPELRDEIAQQLRELSDSRGGMIFRDMERACPTCHMIHAGECL